MIVYQVQSQDITQTKNKIYDTFTSLQDAEKCLEKVKNDYVTFITNQYKVATQQLEATYSSLTAQKELYMLVNDRAKVDEVSVLIKPVKEKLEQFDYISRNSIKELTFSIKEIDVKGTIL